MDRLQSIRVFQQVVDDGSFAAAARKFDMSAAVVTRLVGDLEEHLGVRLLQRTTRRLALTDAGEAYLARVRHILNDIDEAHAAAQAHAQEMSDRVCDEHIKLYVNEHSLDIGDEGLRAIERLVLTSIS